MSEESGSWVRDVTEVDFEARVLEASRQTPVVVDFWADWCSPCRTLGPALERLVEERGGRVLLAKVDVDAARQLAALFRIQSVPTVVAFRDGKVVDHFTGVLPEEELRAFFDRLCPGAEEAEDAEDAPGERPPPAGAAAPGTEERLRAELEKEPANAHALVDLAALLAERKELREAKELLDRAEADDGVKQVREKWKAWIALRQAVADLPGEEELRARVEADPADREAHLALARRLAASERYQEALDELLAAAEGDKPFARDSVRPLMVGIFYIVGVRDPLADEYRSRLARLLY